MTPRISVIMPMYNSEKYVELAIYSLLNQTFSDFEAIFIDDCSTDKTLKKVKKFKDSRIKIIQNKINLGMPGAVRNIGLDIARGDYIYFLDNDDVMLPNCLELLISTAEQSGADVVSSTISLHAENSDFHSLNEIKVKALQTGRVNEVSSNIKQRITEEIMLRYTHCALWLSLYRTNFINRGAAPLRFSNCVGEDAFWLFDVVCSTEKIIKIDKPVYIWRSNEHSASHSASRLKRDMEAVVKVCKYVEERLANIEDKKFVDEVACFISTDLMMNYILQFFVKEPEKTLEAIGEVINKIYGENSLFVKNIIKNYMIEYMKTRNLLAR